jgi:hypothetical protein
LYRHFDRGIGRFYLWAATYPLFYWMLMLVIEVVATPRALFGRRQATTHSKTERIALEEKIHLPSQPERAARRVRAPHAGRRKTPPRRSLAVAERQVSAATGHMLRHVRLHPDA